MAKLVAMDSTAITCICVRICICLRICVCISILCKGRESWQVKAKLVSVECAATTTCHRIDAPQVLRPDGNSPLTRSHLNLNPQRQNFSRVHKVPSKHRTQNGLVIAKISHCTALEGAPPLLTPGVKYTKHRSADADPSFTLIWLTLTQLSQFYLGQPGLPSSWSCSQSCSRVEVSPPGPAGTESSVHSCSATTCTDLPPPGPSGCGRPRPTHRAQLRRRCIWSSFNSCQTQTFNKLFYKTFSQNVQGLKYKFMWNLGVHFDFHFFAEKGHFSPQRLKYWN